MSHPVPASPAPRESSVQGGGALRLPRRSWPALITAAVVGGAVAAALVLWAHFGTAVFFETIAAGIAACF